MDQCMICLDNIKNCDQHKIEHNKCKYIIHKRCASYKKCLYCHKELYINADKMLYFIIDELINLCVSLYLNYMIDKLDILYIIRITYVLFFILFILCPIIFVYKFKDKLIIFALISSAYYYYH